MDMMNMNKKTLLVLMAASGITIFGIGHSFFGKSRSYADTPRATPTSVATTSVTTIIAAPTELDTIVTAAGALTSKNTSVLSSKVMGRIVELNVREGDTIQQGQILMKIESGEIAAQAYQAQAAFINAKSQYDRIKRLFDDKAATQMEMDQATLGLESAKAGLNAARAMEGYTIISAPIAGQIVEKRINVGEMALPGQPLLKIDDNAHLRLEATVNEQDISHIRIGMPVNVSIDALPGKEFASSVSQIVPSADPRTHSFLVKIDLAGGKGLITGMYGKARFSTGRRSALMVPRKALITLSGLTGVYLVAPDGNAIFQMIQPGVEHGTLIEAQSGIKAGDRVIVEGQTAGIDGKKVAAQA